MENCNKRISLALALAMSSAGFAQTAGSPSFEQGYELGKDRYPAAYNASARTEVQSHSDLFFTGSFLYWYTSQEAMDLANYNTEISGVTVQLPTSGETLKQHCEYKPGFKIGLGMNISSDQWAGLFEYTRFHQSSVTSASPGDLRGGTPIWVVTNWYTSDGFATPLNSESIASRWRVNVDLLDATLSRPFYQGRNWILLPYGGIRGAMITQNFRMSIQALNGSSLVAWDPLISHNHSSSRAIGPRLGMKGHWMIRGGLRFEGEAAGSVLFTRYSTVSHREDPFTIGQSPVAARFTNYNAVRPMAELKIGMGWGSYFVHRNYHLDFLATYDFNLLWRQNMMRALVDPLGINMSSAPGDLFLHGLSVTARFDF